MTVSEEFYSSMADSHHAPMEPKTPCREMETRACVVLTTDDKSRYRINQCPVGECVRFPNRDKRR